MKFLNSKSCCVMKYFFRIWIQAKSRIQKGHLFRPLFQAISWTKDQIGALRTKFFQQSKMPLCTTVLRIRAMALSRFSYTSCQWAPKLDLHCLQRPRTFSFNKSSRNIAMAFVLLLYMQREFIGTGFCVASQIGTLKTSEIATLHPKYTGLSLLSKRFSDLPSPS